MDDTNFNVPITRPATQVSQVPTAIETKYPVESVELSSKGYFYPPTSPLSSGTVDLKIMTAKEEDILVNQQLLRSGEALEKLLKALIIDTSVNTADILMIDKNGLFLAIRRLAYGDQYPVIIKCSSCANQDHLSINLAELKDKPFDFTKFVKGVNLFEFTLPNCGKKITYKFLSQKEDDEMEKEIKSMTKVSNNAGSFEITTRLKHVIQSIDGNIDKGVIRKFIDTELLARDSFALRRHIRENTPDVDMSFDFKCSKCGEERRSDIPISLDFFWPQI